ncbi:MAG: 5-dehydro-4-deoxy-D-glucuronate isomerase [Chitinophagaceae bacterium]|nr:5-dehydro-4-deoxy-D-glucuronate isomerase [Chitinophagaceae bacterium]
MEIRYAIGQQETKLMDTASLRAHFLIQSLMLPNKLTLVYTHYDRMIVGGVVPVNEIISLTNPHELRANYFLERREMGVINVGGAGFVIAGKEKFVLNKLDGLYIGKGTEEVQFGSLDSTHPALFYILSAPAHQTYPISLCTAANAAPVSMGAQQTSNKRTIYKYIHQQGIQSCQLVMGLTILEEGNVWNSMPPHTHSRRMEVYFYFDVTDTARVMHFLGTSEETRHIVVANNEAVLSPPWSTHFGCGTMHYGFIWGMAGENLAYTDMDPITMDVLK